MHKTGCGFSHFVTTGGPGKVEHTGLRGLTHCVGVVGAILLHDLITCPAGQLTMSGLSDWTQVTGGGGGGGGGGTGGTLGTHCCAVVSQCELLLLFIMQA